MGARYCVLGHPGCPIRYSYLRTRTYTPVTCTNYGRTKCHVHHTHAHTHTYTHVNIHDHTHTYPLFLSLSLSVHYQDKFIFDFRWVSECTIEHIHIHTLNLIWKNLEVWMKPALCPSLFACLDLSSFRLCFALILKELESGKLQPLTWLLLMPHFFDSIGR